MAVKRPRQVLESFAINLKTKLARNAKRARQFIFLSCHTVRLHLDPPSLDKTEPFRCYEWPVFSSLTVPY